jgi:ABC-2 type transport system permease protein
MNAWQITKKDLRLLVRDRRTLFVLVALPLAFISILGVSAGQLFNEKEKTRKVRIGVIDQDQSELSGKLLTEVLKLKALEVSQLTDRSAARELLDDGKIEVLVTIGPHYHEVVAGLDVSDIFFTDDGRLSGKLQSLDVEVEAGAFLANAAEVVQELVFAFSLRTIAPDVFQAEDSAYFTRLLLKAKRKRAARERDHSGRAGSAGPTSLPSRSRADIIYQYLVPSYTVMFVFFIVNFMARSLIHERDTGTLNRLRMAPLSRTGLMLGKTAPFFLISIVQTVLLFVAGKALFRMSWGEYPGVLAPVILCTSLAATCLGLMVATAVRTESQVSAYGNFLVLTMAGISGCLMPRSWQPELMQQIGLITPHAWALIAYDHLLNREITQNTLPVVWRCCGILCGFSVAFFTIGWWRFRTLD